MAIPVRWGAVYALAKEIRSTTDRPLLVGGILKEELARELRAGGDPTAVLAGGAPKAKDVEALVYVIGDEVSDDDTLALKKASRARVPAIVVAAGRKAPRRVPFVPATDVVRAHPGQGFPVEAISRAIADRLGEEATSLARRLPILRRPVARSLINSFARRNGLIGVAVFVPGVDMPILTLHQVRMVLRICAAYGLDIDGQRAPELLTTIGAGFGFRAVARQMLAFIPFAGWALKGTIAYAGTRALGAATVRYCEARAAAAAMPLQTAAASASSS